MFEYLAEYPVILVTGPQRSGTRIMAKCVAYDLGHEYIDENEIKTDSLYELEILTKYQRGDRRLVVQCPALMYAVQHIVRRTGRDFAVVVVMRDIKDIVASQQRARWIWEYLEAWHYEEYPCPIAEVKYEVWRSVQRHQVPNWFEVEYESLADHSLWVPAEQRKDFDAWQTEVKE